MRSQAFAVSVGPPPILVGGTALICIWSATAHSEASPNDEILRVDQVDSDHFNMRTVVNKTSNKTFENCNKK